MVLTRIDRLIQEIEDLDEKERQELTKRMAERGISVPEVQPSIIQDPFAQLRANIPTDVTDEEIEDLIAKAVRSIRHSGISERSNC
jgi:7-keto-8-aminopelargonate synthetase-like enzyme